jgi:sterol desaturase/sphingolipid hydroxylase (fatty acid hydroxylase superfamily)
MRDPVGEMWSIARPVPRSVSEKDMPTIAFPAGLTGWTDMKKIMFSYVQPVMVAATLLFWFLAPDAWVKSAWSLTIATSVMTLLVLGLEWLHERHASWRLTKKEFFTDLFYVVMGSTVISWVTTKLAEDPLKAAKHGLGISTEWALHLPFAAQVAIVIFLVEFGQYWMHRLMHNTTPFWLTHAPHHHITQLNAMKGAVGNPIELFLISLSVVALFDLSLAAELCAFNVLAIVSTFAHANTRCDPPRWYAFFFTTIRNHSLHHSVGYEETRCNYANSLILLDRIFGTYRDGEAEAVGQDERRRLSIPEQMIFPFQPVIAKVRAKRSLAEASSVRTEAAGFEPVATASPVAAA